MEGSSARPEDRVLQRHPGSGAAVGPAPGGPGTNTGHRAYGASDGGYAVQAGEDTPAQILLRGLVDDAGLCPPDGHPLQAASRHHPATGRGAPPDHLPLPVVQAVERHRSDGIVGHPMLSHRLLCPIGRWAELLNRLNGSEPIEVGLILDTAEGTAGEVPERDSRVRVAHYETRARPDDLRLVAELFRSGEIGAAGRVVYFEPVREPDWLEAIDILSGARPLGAKIRCGGPRSELVPSARELGAFITACVERDVPFITAAGLHRAAARTDAATGAAQYGYLNVLLATAAVVEGDYDDVVDLLTSSDPWWLARLATGLDPATALRTRELLMSYGSRSTGDPVREAAELGLLGSWQV
ncbi:hypothetical protein GCM10027570_34620 [Streptomonospora sediminis]